jgi:hypothetical protein
MCRLGLPFLSFLLGDACMTDRVRLCARCKQPIEAERVECLPQTRLCVACARVVEKKYGGEFRTVVQSTKMGRPGGLKITGVAYETKKVRNRRVPLRFDEENEA